jgi:hypothetical protein
MTKGINCADGLEHAIKAYRPDNDQTKTAVRSQALAVRSHVARKRGKQLRANLRFGYIYDRRRQPRKTTNISMFVSRMN